MYVDKDVANEEDPDVAMISVGREADRQSSSPTRIVDLAWGILGQMCEKVASSLVEAPPAAKGKKGEPVEVPKGPSLEDALPKIMQACADVLSEGGGAGDKASFGLALVFEAEAAWDDETKTYDVEDGGLGPQELFEFWTRCANITGEGLWLLVHPFRHFDTPSASKFCKAHPSISVAVSPYSDGTSLNSSLTIAGVPTPSWSRLYAYETDPEYGLISMPEDPDVFELLLQHVGCCPSITACQNAQGRKFLRIGTAVPDELVSALGSKIGYHFENQWLQQQGLI
jgi:hypothetical protein